MDTITAIFANPALTFVLGLVGSLVVAYFKDWIDKVRTNRAIRKKEKLTAKRQLIADEAVRLVADPTKAYHMRLEVLTQLCMAAIQLLFAIFSLLIAPLTLTEVPDNSPVRTVVRIALWVLCYGLFISAVNVIRRTKDMRQTLYVYELLKDDKEIKDAIRAGTLPKKAP